MTKGGDGLLTVLWLEVTENLVCLERSPSCDQVPKDVLARIKQVEHVTASHALHGCSGLGFWFWCKFSIKTFPGLHCVFRFTWWSLIVSHQQQGPHLQHEHLYHRVLGIQKAGCNMEFLCAILPTQSFRLYIYIYYTVDYIAPRSTGCRDELNICNCWISDEGQVTVVVSFPLAWQRSCARINCHQLRPQELETAQEVFRSCRLCHIVMPRDMKSAIAELPEYCAVACYCMLSRMKSAVV